ncbi:hypothetical protein [Leisingera sp. F5]|uniref:hypothetical protein n=1 Tax=Leisingera sp. F5 TaxID=1813816 RepID=UPI000A91F574|nr:hypothetical protein [Leisingera sp. F5]
MADQRAYLHTLVRGIVAKHFPGKQNCAAREIAEFWAGRELEDHEVDYGGFSRKMKGSREFSLNDVVALMSITGSRRIITVLQQMQDQMQAPLEPREALAAAAAKEAGEAVAAAIGTHDNSIVAKKAGDAEAAFRRIREQAEAVLSNKGNG